MAGEKEEGCLGNNLREVQRSGMLLSNQLTNIYIHFFPHEGKGFLSVSFADIF